MLPCSAEESAFKMNPLGNPPEVEGSMKVLGGGYSGAPGGNSRAKMLFVSYSSKRGNL